MLGGSGELRHPGRHLGEQGQVPWTTDGPSLVPRKDHKATEKVDGTVTSVKERMLKTLTGCIPASSSLSKRDQRDSSQWEEWKLGEG